MSFLNQLKQRNVLLYWFGWFNLLVGVTCFIAMLLDEAQLLGVSRWLKPMKFYLSVGIMIWTLGWLMHYLENKRKVRRFSIIIFIAMLFENGLILMQAIRNTTSHFNNKTAFDSIVFSIMGILIIIFTVVCIRICIVFFAQKQFNLPIAYLWGIRLGLLLFIIFSLEGFIMVSMLKHTVGAADGSPGLPLLNWSRQYGDLRIAHFLGIHSLQILPLVGFYLLSTKRQMMITATLYFAAVMFVFIQALRGIPLFS